MIIYVHLLSKISPSLKNEKGSVLLPLRKNEVCMDEDLKFIPMYKLLVTEAMTNLDSILKRRDITLLMKVCIVKAMIFPLIMYAYESWTIKKTEQRIDAFKLGDGGDS